MPPLAPGKDHPLPGAARGERPCDFVTLNWCQDRELLPGPLLVGAAVAGPDLDRSAVGGACPGHIETQTGLNADDGAVGVEVPLLVSATVAVPDLHAGASSGGVIGHVETLVAVDL